MLVPLDLVSFVLPYQPPRSSQSRKNKVNLTWKDLVDKKEDRAKLIEDSASIENFNELAGELEEFLKDRLGVLGK